MPASGHPVILFDGQCNLCNASVRFVVRRDPKEHFRFASLQSATGQALLQKHGLKNDLNTIVLVQEEHAWTHSSAALRIARRLTAAWPILALFLVLPPFLRDPVYRFIAKRRYRWFGQSEACPLPDPALQHLFLDT